MGGRSGRGGGDCGGKGFEGIGWGCVDSVGIGYGMEGSWGMGMEDGERGEGCVFGWDLWGEDRE